MIGVLGIFAVQYSTDPNKRSKPSGPRVVAVTQIGGKNMGTMTGKPLIESDRVEGTTIYDSRGNNIGSVKRLMI